MLSSPYCDACTRDVITYQWLGRLLQAHDLDAVLAVLRRALVQNVVLVVADARAGAVERLAGSCSARRPWCPLVVVLLRGVRGVRLVVVDGWRGRFRLFAARHAVVGQHQTLNTTSLDTEHHIIGH